MRRFPLLLGLPTGADLDQLRAASVTYEHVGSTLVEVPPAAQRIESSVRLGTGPGTFSAGRRALRGWRPQRSLGASIRPEGVAPDLAETVVLGFGLGPARLAVPTRIVAVIDEPGRYGYAYGTLPGHPERGEELFVIDRIGDDEVVLTIRADSEPAGLLRHVRPLVQVLQQTALNRYLTAVQRAVGRSGDG